MKNAKVSFISWKDHEKRRCSNDSAPENVIVISFDFNGNKKLWSAAEVTSVTEEVCGGRMVRVALKVPF